MARANKLSPLTRRDLTDQLRSGKWHGQLSEIDFLGRLYDLDAMPSNDSRLRNARADIDQHRVKWTNDWLDDWVFSDERFELASSDKHLLDFITEALHPLVRDSAEAQTLSEALNACLRPDGYELFEKTQMSGRPVYAWRKEGALQPSSIASAKKHALEFNSDYLRSQVKRMEAAVDSDPDLAIGTAKELIESCCKTILSELKIAFEQGEELIPLVKKTCGALKLTPNDVDDSDPTAEILRRVTGNLASIAHGVTELRNKHGTGHGKSATFRGLSARHARLAVGASSSLVSFLFDTHKGKHVGF